MVSAKEHQGELYGIQMLRALAALAVVAHHALEESNGAAGRFSPDWLTTAGASGVDLFFVISGFIMLHVSFRPGREPIGAGAFLFRRATRIYPFYWFCCCMVLAFAAVGFFNNHRWSAGEILGSFLLIPTNNLLLGVAWTLVFEMYFYLIFALTLLLFSSEVLSVIGTTIAIFVFMALANFFPDGALKIFLTSPLPLEFCMGLWLAWAFSHAGTSIQRSTRVLPILAIIGFGIMVVAPLFVAHPNTNGLPAFTRVVVWGLPAVFIVAAFLRAGPPRNGFTRFAVFLGDASYALYLLHSFVMPAYAKILKSSFLSAYSQTPFVVLVVALSVIIALVAHVKIEQPLLAMVRKLAGRSRGIASRSSLVAQPSAERPATGLPSVAFPTSGFEVEPCSNSAKDSPDA